jgi:hypothetical protein
MLLLLQLFLQIILKNKSIEELFHEFLFVWGFVCPCFISLFLSDSLALASGAASVTLSN